MALTLQGGLSACCKTLIHNLVAANAPSAFNPVTNFQTLQALQSDRNLAGADPNFIRLVNEQWGKHAINDAASTCKFKLKVEKPWCGEATEGALTICNNSNTTHPVENRIEFDVEISNAYSAQGLIEPSDFTCLCNGTQAEVIQREITRAAIKILTSVDKAVVAEIATLMGNYSNGTDSTVTTAPLNLFTTAMGNFQLQPQGWMPLLLEYEKMKTQGGVIAVGGDIAYQYSTLPGLSRSITGEYLLPNGIAMYYDPEVNTLATETLVNPLLTWAPGAIHLMRYLDNFNVTEYQFTSDSVKKQIVELFGHLFDLSMTIDAACNKLRWTLVYRYDLFSLPSSAFADCLETNQKLLFDVGCDAYDCDQLAPPAA